MRKTSPKRHHYVPQMLQKHFTDDRGFLFAFLRNFPNRGVLHIKPENIFLEGHLYSRVEESGVVDTSMETKLSQLEDRSDTIISKIVSSVRVNKIPDLSSGEKEVLYKFIYMQWKRVPDLQNTVNTSAEANEIYDDLINELHTLFPERKMEIYALQNKDTKLRVIRNCRVDLLEHFSEDVLSIFRKRGIAILKIVAKDKKFIIGSRPVVKLTVNSDYNLLNHQNELWLPIASDIAVGLDVSENTLKLYPVTSREAIRSLNMAISRQSTIFAGESMALIKSLAHPK